MEDYFCTWSYSMIHTHTHSVGLLRERDCLVAETSTWQHKHSKERGIHASAGNRTHYPRTPAAADPCLRLRSHGNQLCYQPNVQLCRLERYHGSRCWWRSWLRHCATSRKVVGSIPDGVTGIFWHNPSGCTMTRGLNQPLIEISTRNISWE